MRRPGSWARISQTGTRQVVAPGVDLRSAGGSAVWAGRSTGPSRRLVRARSVRHPTACSPTCRDPTARYPTSRHLTGRHPTSRHLTGRHLTGRHPTSRHPTSRRPTGRHPTSRRPTGRHPTSRRPNGRHLTSRRPTSAHWPDVRCPEYRHRASRHRVNHLRDRCLDAGVGALGHCGQSRVGRRPSRNPQSWARTAQTVERPRQGRQRSERQAGLAGTG